MTFRQIFVFLLIITVFFIGCQKENTQNKVNYYYSYFPLTKGLQRIYKVTDRTIDKDINFDSTLTYELMEIVDSFYTDIASEPAWRIVRFTRADSTKDWHLIDVWENQVSNNNAFSIEENIRIVKLIFPPKSGVSWNGNAFNTLASKTFTITDIDKQLEINDMSFDSVLTVYQDKSETMINKYHTIENYAVNVGLINKTIISIDYAQIIPGLPIEQRISRGRLYYQTIISTQIIPAK
ncbi:MAG: hypothetical protein HY951_10820 [Bacteroidia bacterium]|nr:hypothetical protein [Bacteroidia bacterium]